jgi:hypothetical protein
VTSSKCVTFYNILKNKYRIESIIMGGRDEIFEIDVVYGCCPDGLDVRGAYTPLRPELEVSP